MWSLINVSSNLHTTDVKLTAYSRWLASRMLEKCGVFHDFCLCFVVISLTFLFGARKNVILLMCINTSIYNREPCSFFAPECLFTKKSQKIENFH